MAGIMIRHKRERSVMVLVPIMSKPLLGDSAKKVCPGCHIFHGVKTVHAPVSDTGLIMVSPGVLEDLKLAGNFEQDWELVGEEKNPPPINIDGNSPLSLAEQRARDDFDSRKIIVRR